MPSSQTTSDRDKKTVVLSNRPTKKPPLYYQVLLGLIKPLYRLQVWHRSHNNANYQQEVAQRFGKAYPARPSAQDAHGAKVIWCHAVSLGETNTIAPLLDALLASGYHIWLTNTTQTGHARGAKRFADDIAEGRMSHSYVPVDTIEVIDAFLHQVRPIAALFVETELWANILATLSERHIPSILVNGRMSASSFKSYQKIAAVSSSMMQNLTVIIAQDDESAKRFRKLGALSVQIRVAGSLKWVINTPSVSNQEPQTLSKHSMRESYQIDNDRPVWVAASTHVGEEATVLSLQQRITAVPTLKNTLLIIVPRHPERFDEVADLIKKSGLQMARRSHEETIDRHTQVYLADTMGELMQWYSVANVALVGGSIADIGGHNPVEPASVATPIIMGSFTQSCQGVVDKLASVGALYQPNNPYYQSIKEDELSNDSNKTSTINAQSIAKCGSLPAKIEDNEQIYQHLQHWLENPYYAKISGEAGAQLTLQQQTVLNRQLGIIEAVIEHASRRDPL